MCVVRSFPMVSAACLGVTKGVISFIFFFVLEIDFSFCFRNVEGPVSVGTVSVIGRSVSELCYVFCASVRLREGEK